MNVKSRFWMRLMHFCGGYGRAMLLALAAGLIKPEAELLDEIQTKVLGVFLLVIHSHLYSFYWDFYFFKLTQLLTVSVMKKGVKPDRKPYPLPNGLRYPFPISLKVTYLSRSRSMLFLLLASSISIIISSHRVSVSSLVCLMSIALFRKEKKR
jgi:hypothetical protein